MNQSDYSGEKDLCGCPESTGEPSLAVPGQTSAAGGLAHAEAEERGIATMVARRVRVTWLGLILGALLLMGVAGAGGYYARAFRENAVSILAPGALPALEYFVSAQSFSEVEEAKNLLQASADRVIQEMRDRSGVGGRGGRVTGVWDPAEKHEFRQVETELRQRIVEFKGTAAEHALVKEYLWLLCREEQPERFLEVYLSALYPHPTEGLVGLFAERALGVSRILGREPEVLKALEYASNIPLEFEGKGRILAAMEGARWVAQTARLESKRAL